MKANLYAKWFVRGNLKRAANADDPLTEKTGYGGEGFYAPN